LGVGADMGDMRVYGEETEYGGTFVSSLGKCHRISDNQLKFMVKKGTVCSEFCRNGAKIYPDQGHIEYATPECLSPLDVVAYSKAGERILEDVAKEVTEYIEEKSENKVAGKVRFYRHNVDNQRNFLRQSVQRTFGCHENYSFDPARIRSSDSVKKEEDGILFAEPGPSRNRDALLALYHNLLPFFITRNIWSGAGNVVTEDDRLVFRLTQRIPFFNALANATTLANRGIFNWRDEPHSQKLGRLHVICGDANMGEYVSLLKFGATGMIIGMVEDGYRFGNLNFEKGLDVLCAIDKNFDFSKRYACASGGFQSPLDVQRSYLRSAREWLKGRRDAGDDDGFSDIADIWEETLDMLDDGDPALERRLDWLAKRSLLRSAGSRIDLSGRYSDGDKIVKLHPVGSAEQINLQYHDIDTSSGLYYLLVKEGLMDTFLSKDEVDSAIRDAPLGSRAATRRSILDFFDALNREGFDISAYKIHWDSFAFSFEKHGVTHKGYVNLAEPFDSSEATLDEITRRILSVRRRS
jgi:proteasome accessory factor A